MIELRAFNELGGAHHGWLDTKHHFSFAGYHDPKRMHWGDLRVWNDDTIAPQTGFDPHSHRDMEIITYVREGAITHAEYNLEDTPTRIFQIWIIPNATGLPPTWGSRPFPKAGRDGGFKVLASGYDDGDALPIQADGRVAAAALSAGQEATYTLEAGRKAYLVPATGRVRVNGVLAEAGDGLAIEDERELVVNAEANSEIVLVDVPGPCKSHRRSAFRRD